MHKLFAKLYRNHLSTQPNKYFARVLSRGTVDNQTIACRIVSHGSEFKMETIKNILDLADRYKSDALLEGYRVQSGFVNISLEATTTKPSQPESNGDYRVKVRCRPTALFREALDKIRLDIRGIAHPGPVVNQVVDSLTQSVNQWITPGYGLLVEGVRLKIEGDPNVNGVFFVDSSGERIKARQLIRNDRKQLIVLTPPLPSGAYRLEVRSQFSPGSKPLNQPLTYLFDQLLEVRNPD